MSVHKTPNPEKGARYLGLLDQALCNGSWSEIPELARKVDKHAPGRKCLTIAARAESQIASASHRPASASSGTSTSVHGLGEIVPRLTEGIGAAGKDHQDDAFVASSCLAEIYWLREAPVEALKVLDETVGPSTNAKSPAGTLGWIEVCAVKNDFIRASCFDTLGRKSEARESYQAAVVKTPGYRTPELRRWTSKLLARACMYSVKKMPSPSVQDFNETYAAFRSWGDFWQRAGSVSGGKSSTSDVPRRQVWKAYYDLLSTILQHGLLYAPGPGQGSLILPDSSISVEQRQAARTQQRAELKRVEATYESLLLEETKFPKASQSNTEVEEWTEQVISNWRIFSGSTWTDADLGEGGKRAVSRGVLDILYRAATKTFHSTPILRELFTVHAALGEFDLAIHAFDSYIEIVDKGKARAEKTGKHEIGLDSDDTAMTTAAEAVRLLCRYGDREHAEKAIEITKAMQKWLEQRRPASPEITLTNGDAAQNGSRPFSQPTSSVLKPETLAAAYRALGMSQAHWARLTYEAETQRPTLAEANNNLKRAEKYDADSVETGHALALVLADMRDVSGAVDAARSTIQAAGKSQQSNGAGSAAAIDLEKRLIPLWHLLALCSTAEDEYETAAHICEAAYRQFGGSKVLFGDSGASTSSDPEKSTAALRGIVDQMEGFEKESLIQIKMTQILLFELTEGSEEAIDLTAELLSLYSRLFGKPEQVVAEVIAKPPQTAASHAPSRLGGTLRSITGSIRPRSSARSARSSGEKDATRQRSLVSVDDSLAPPSTQNVAASTNGQATGPPIAITVTNEDGVSSEKPHHHHHLPHLPFQKRGRSRSTERRIPEVDEKASSQDKATPAPQNAAVSEEKRPDQPLGEMAHNAPPEQWPPPPGHEEHPPQQDVRLPAPHPANANTIPEPQLLPIHERRHRVSVLVKAWLFSAELYIRAETLDDAESLVNDAFKLTESLELELAQTEDGSNARRLFAKGWGSGKSIDELWAEAWSTKALLLLGRERPHEAMAAYEQAISYHPDHPAGTIGLSNLLLDIYEENLPAEQPQIPVQPFPSASGSLSLINEARPTLTRPGSAATLPSRRPSIVVEPEPVELKERKIDPSPAELNRLAARDRAYMLLSNLTKHAGWDNSEAWLGLARAHELSKEIDKAKQALWWVVELEETQPIRPWREVTPGGYTV
ncbi:hypothetical protein PRZ48_006907 [Zasmidium cellare]|uniref:Filamentation protein n=1 Tax=Zasmidium cellare TaxID=395010 RepID=A0ABR0EIM7_ZASCE|nr:hypothetical protein PRZ48_006907 [Zasmidium cellare]